MRIRIPNTEKNIMQYAYFPAEVGKNCILNVKIPPPLFGGGVGGKLVPKNIEFKCLSKKRVLCAA